jgi:p-aminobenzoyl-glutamate transporter AbgT
MARSKSHVFDRHGHFLSTDTDEKTTLERLLDLVERVGNRVPHPAVIFVLLIGLVILLSRNPETGSLVTDSPFMNGLIVFIALAFLVAGAAYGFGAGTMKSNVDVIKAMEKAIAGLGA